MVKIDRILRLCQFAFTLVIGVISQQEARTHTEYTVDACRAFVVVLSLVSSFFFFLCFFLAVCGYHIALNAILIYAIIACFAYWYNIFVTFFI